MTGLSSFEEHVSTRFQLYNGLFLQLPFAQVRSAAILLPLFADFVREGLESGEEPRVLVDRFFAERLGKPPESDRIDLLFRFLQLVERQVVLFDAVEDAAFRHIHPPEGPGSLRDLQTRVQRDGREDEYDAVLDDFEVRIVLTAHPTQFYPDEVLTILSELSKAIARDDVREVSDLLLQMGQTRFRNRRKPTPLDEAQSLMWFMEHVFYNVVPRVQLSLVSGVDTPSSDSLRRSPNLSLGFWPGGDRDGNPFVTSDLTLEIGDLLRSTVLRLYEQDLLELARRLTFDGTTELVDRALDRIRRTRAPLVRSASGTESAWIDRSSEGYAAAKEFLEELIVIRERVRDRHLGLYLDRVDELIAKVRIFGFHFASMDLRQHRGVHETLVAELLEALAEHRLVSLDAPYPELSEDARVRALDDAAAAISRMTHQVEKILPEGFGKDTIRSLRAARELQERNGEPGVHRYIVSHSRFASNALEVRILAIAAGWDPDDLRLDIVPLFETITDIEAATDTMGHLYAHPAYRQHLTARGGRQHIMLGFSDGTKDGGYLLANWRILEAKARLSEQAVSEGLTVIFFDGRGGPPARGGGNSHKFYRSLGQRVRSNAIHLTVQGQTVSSKFGNRDNAMHNLEQLITAGLENRLFPRQERDGAEDADLIESLARASGDAYRTLREHPSFVSYLEQLTPLRYYGESNVGSRPSSRKQSSKLSLDDLRAIPFVGAWSQMKQNVPGYFGVGSALEAAAEADGGKALRELYRHNYFMRAVIENAMQSLSKTWFALTAFIRQDAEFGEFWQILADEAERSSRMFRSLSDSRELLEHDPMTRQSIRLRERMIHPVLAIQQYALAVLRNGADEDSAEIHRKLVIKSMAAIVNASRNSV